MIRPPRSSETEALVQLAARTGLFTPDEANALLRSTFEIFQAVGIVSTEGVHQARRTYVGIALYLLLSEFHRSLALIATASALFHHSIGRNGFPEDGAAADRIN